MSHVIIRNGAPFVLPAGRPFADNNHTQHPASVLRLWAASDLSAIDVYPVIDRPIPDGHRATGWRLHRDGETVIREYASEPVPLAERQAALLEAVRERRWQAETGGCVVNGVAIRTDEQSQAKIDAAIALFDKDPTLAAIDFEAQPGEWVTLDKLAITAIGIAAGRHVQAAFSRARALSDAIAAAESIEALEAIDIEAGWPGAGLSA